MNKWAVSLLSGWLIVPVLVVFVGLPSIFSTLNDKRNIVIATPGPVRVVIELLLYGVAAVAPWFVWPTALCVLAMLVVVASLFTGVPRLKWPLQGAAKIP